MEESERLNGDVKKNPKAAEMKISDTADEGVIGKYSEPEESEQTEICTLLNVVKSLQSVWAEIKLLGSELADSGEDGLNAAGQLEKLARLNAVLENAIKLLQEHIDKVGYYKRNNHLKYELSLGSKIDSRNGFNRQNTSEDVKVKVEIHEGESGEVKIELESDPILDKIDGSLKLLQRISASANSNNEILTDDIGDEPANLYNGDEPADVGNDETADVDNDEEFLPDSVVFNEASSDEPEDKSWKLEKNETDDAKTDSSPPPTESGRRMSAEKVDGPHPDAAAAERCPPLDGAGGKKKKRLRKIASSYKCVLCNNVFGQKVDRDRHVRKEHGDGPFSCEACSKSLSNFTKLRRHVERHNRAKAPLVECQVCKKKLSKSSLRHHMVLHNGGASHECPVCSRKFVDACFLKRHIRFTHEGKTPFHCLECGKGFRSKASLKVHSVVHTGEKPYTCHLCGNSYTQSTHLKRHIAWNHEGKRPAAKSSEEDAKKEQMMCGECGKLYANQRSLKVHQRTHTGVKPYTCELCNKSFSQFSGLYTHRKAIHDSESQPRITCEVCNKTYKNVASFKMHMRTHKDTKSYNCDMCAKSFSMQWNLQRHIKVVHKGEKPFPCEICNQAFSCPWSLKQHMPVHTGEKPFQCDVCDKCFTQNSSLSVHKKKYHQAAAV